jgi:citrate synthase
MSKRQVYYSNFWEEIAEDDNPFATKEAYCHGYNVYKDILQKASWFEYLYVMFKGEKPTAPQAKLLEKLAIALANPGPREASVRAAMNGGVAKAAHASSLMCALAVGAGQYGGSHEVYLAHVLFSKCGLNLEMWREVLLKPADKSYTDIWLPMEHIAGFDPNGETTPTVLLNILDELAKIEIESSPLIWLRENRGELESVVGYPMSITLIAAATFYALGFDEHQASMLFLILRLPGAAAHALEQRDVGWKRFPFYSESIQLMNDPGDKGLPKVEGLNL